MVQMFFLDSEHAGMGDAPHKKLTSLLSRGKQVQVGRIPPTPNIDIHTFSITEHAFLENICTGSFTTFKRYKTSIFPDLN